MRGCVMRVWRRYLDDKPWRILLRKVTTSSNLPNHQHGHPVLPGAEAVNSTYRPVDANDAAGYWPGSSVSHNVSVTRLAAAPALCGWDLVQLLDDALQARLNPPEAGDSPRTRARAGTSCTLRAAGRPRGPPASAPPRVSPSASSSRRPRGCSPAGSSAPPRRACTGC